MTDKPTILVTGATGNVEITPYPLQSYLDTTQGEIVENQGGMGHEIKGI